MIISGGIDIVVKYQNGLRVAGKILVEGTDTPVLIAFDPVRSWSALVTRNSRGKWTIGGHEEYRISEVSASKPATKKSTKKAPKKASKGAKL